MKSAARNLIADLRSGATLDDIQNSDIAFDLLGKLKGGSQLEEALLSRISRLMPAGSTNWRLTGMHRLEAVDDAICDFVDEHLHDRRPIRVHDVACSNAITSVDLFTRLQHIGSLEFLASDLHTEITVMKTALGTIVFDDRQRWIQIQFRDKAYYPRQPNVNRRRFNVLSGWTLLPLLRFSAFFGVERKSVNIMHPTAQALSRDDRRFRIGRRDALSPSTDTFNVIRFMNVIYNWPDELSLRAIKTLGSSLEEGGIIVVGFGVKHLYKRSRAPQCSIFLRKGPRLVRVTDIYHRLELTDAIERIRL